MSKILLICIGILYTVLSKGENINKEIRIIDDSLQIQMTSPQNKIIHIQVTPVGTKVKESLIVPKKTDISSSHCRILEKENSISIQTQYITATYSYKDKNIYFTDIDLKRKIKFS